jgi:hypothetical protein
MTINAACNTTMSHGKMRRSAKEDAITPSVHPVRTTSQTTKRCRRRREHCSDRQAYESNNNKALHYWPLPSLYDKSLRSKVEAADCQ